MVLPSLKEQLAAAGLGRVEAYVSGLSETSIGFWLTAPPQDVQNPPRSALGGTPDVPATFAWPESGGRPLDFLLQLNLSDLRSMEMARLLPRTGVLSFFYDLEGQPSGYDPGDRSGFRVAHFSETSTFVCRSASQEPRLDERCLDFFPRISIPHPRSQAGDLLEVRSEMNESELATYTRFAAEYERRQGPPFSDSNHHFLGHPETISDDMQMLAQLVTKGYGVGDEVPEPVRAKLEPGTSKWILLLQLDSDPSANLRWGNDGMLYFWIPRQDLRERRFDKVWAFLQSH